MDVQKDSVDESAVNGSVPAGGAGADSGSVDAVEIEKGDSAPIQNVSSMNDEPGVGTRGSGDQMERGDGDKREGAPTGGDKTTEEQLEADNAVEADTLKTLDPDAPPA